MELTKIFASSLRQKILRELSTKREIRVMRLVSKVGSTYNDVHRNLMILEREGIVVNDYPIKVREGKVRVIRLDKESPKTKKLLDALKSLDSAEVQ